jgi:hypothetical protein
MGSPDNYNFSLFKPRNLHGKKNRNVILNMLLIWAIAVFGFQFLLRGIQKPTPEKSLAGFESVWPMINTNGIKSIDYKGLLNSLVLVKGKNTVKPGDQKILDGAISCITFHIIPDTIKSVVLGYVADINALKSQLAGAKDMQFLNIKSSILEKGNRIAEITLPYTGLKEGGLEQKIFINSLSPIFPGSLSDETLATLPHIMKLYLTHNQSVLTDTKFLGFPFHYFYTAVFLLILFVCLCIIYNILIEWRLKKEGIVE